MKKKTWGENKNSSWPLGIKTGSLGDKVAVRKEAVRRGQPRDLGRRGHGQHPGCWTRNWKKGVVTQRREKGMALHLVELLAK